MASQTLDAPYELLELIGRGAMGEVFRARHTGLNRFEALKVLSPNLAADQEFVVRLRREARATARLTHPNIVSTYGFGRLDDGRYYLAMEHLSGETLEALCDRDGALPLPLCLRLLFQLASAMNHAHEQDVVHRDIKPANIMVEEQAGGAPFVKVLDFGLAKIINPNYAESLAVSKTGRFFGTPGFMAPERVRGVTTDPAIDVYSFGCVAYTVLTGQPPFVGRGIDVLHAHQDTVPRPPSTHRKIPEPLDAMIIRCLEKDPAKRFADGKELCTAFQEIPGFSAEDARRRSTASVSIVPQRATLGPEIAGTAPTLRPTASTHRTTMDIGETLAFGPTHDFGPQYSEAGYHHALFRLAEDLHRAGCRDTRLISCLAKLSRSRALVQAHDEKLSALLRQREEMDMQFRKQESELRFALGECSFDLDIHDKARAEQRANDLVEELTRCEHLYRRELQEILDQEIAEVSIRHNIVEAQRNDFAALLPVVDGQLDEVVPDETLSALIADFHHAKSAWEAAIRLRYQ